MSAYTNIILWSMSAFIDENGIWEKEIVDSIEILERDMYEWYENESKMISVFFSDMNSLPRQNRSAMLNKNIEANH